MKTRIQMNTSFAKIVACLTYLCLLSASAAANSEGKLGSALSFIPDPEQLAEFAHDQYIQKQLVMDEKSDTITIGYAVLLGTKADSYFNNATGCFDRYTNWTYNDMPPFMAKMTDSSRDTWTKFNDITQATKVIANDLWVCNDMAKNFVVFTDKKAVAFGGSFTTFMTSFF